MEFLQQVKALMRELGMDEKFLQRGVNEGFSGGEKKRNDMLQMALLQPRLAILDETDSGLDVDALKVVAQAVNAMRSPERALVLITHYERLLEVIVPDRVHVLWQGRIVASGGAELARRIEREGYAWLQQGAALASAQEV
jgi:Fe-S cluster assembly ATP-binding protein